MIAWLSDMHHWLAMAEIIGVNIVLSGDNAVVIALACRTLPAKQQRWAILLGSAGAIVLRIVLTAFAAVLLARPYLKLAGGVLLLWIAVKLLLPEVEDDSDSQGQAGLFDAIKTIVIADVVMSLDNVLGVAAAARGDLILLVLGLLISMPLIIYGSTLIMRLMDRYPIVIFLGAGLLGYVAGEMAISDPVVVPWVEATLPSLHSLTPVAAATLVVLTGKWMVYRRQRTPAEVPVDDRASRE